MSEKGIEKPQDHRHFDQEVKGEKNRDNKIREKNTGKHTHTHQNR